LVDNLQTITKGHFTSGCLQRYIRDHGGVINITGRTAIVG
jgi:hypothetical protein